MNVIRTANESNWPVRKHAYRTLFNFLGRAGFCGHNEFIKTDGMRVLCDAINVTKDIDVGLCALSLDVVRALLISDSENDGKLHIRELLTAHHAIECMENLYNCPNPDIFNKCSFILDTFFKEEENDENKAGHAAFTSNVRDSGFGFLPNSK